MLRRLIIAIIALAALAQPAAAQVFFSNTRIGSVVQNHATVGTSAAAAISSSSVASNLLAWKICNDAVNGSSTYLYVGKATDPSTDGVELAPGACFECPNCVGTTLKAARVLGQGASNGYSVLQYKQQ